MFGASTHRIEHFWFLNGGTQFSSDVTAYKVLERVDGRPWLNTALTPRNGGSTLSPYVTVAT